MNNAPSVIEPVYDSTQDTTDHINLVATNMDQMIGNLQARKGAHDQSKLHSPEKEMFDKYTPILKSLKYGSDEYMATVKEMTETALAHHYEHNTHHPEHFGYLECDNCYKHHSLNHVGPCDKCDHKALTLRGDVSGMTLLDIFEMLADWKAAGQRTNAGNIADSLVKNRDRFKLNDQLFAILENTVKELGW